MEVKQMNLNRKPSAKDESLKNNDETLNNTAQKLKGSEGSNTIEHKLTVTVGENLTPGPNMGNI